MNKEKDSIPEDFYTIPLEITDGENTVEVIGKVNFVKNETEEKYE